MKCDNCGEQTARTRQVSRSYGSGKDLLVIEGIPLTSCPNCGESYFTAETLHEINASSFIEKDSRRRDGCPWQGSSGEPGTRSDVSRSCGYGTSDASDEIEQVYD